MKKYEFDFICVRFGEFTDRTRIGAASFQGWEIKTVTSDENYRTYYLQREITETSDGESK